MLIGQYVNKITKKGRTALPSTYRKKIGQEAIVAKWYEGCIVIISKKNWQSHIQRLTGKENFLTLPIRDTDRFILGSAFEIKFDSQGRFVVPKTLRDYAGFRDELIYLGLGERIEIWDKNKWEEREKDIQQKASNMLEQIAKENRKS